MFIVNSANCQFLQDNSKLWYFGDKAGINFNTVPPSILTGSQMIATEGCMSLSKGVYFYFYTN